MSYARVMMRILSRKIWARASDKSRDWLGRMPAGDPEVTGVGLQRAESPNNTPPSAPIRPIVTFHDFPPSFDHG